MPEVIIWDARFTAFAAYVDREARDPYRPVPRFRLFDDAFIAQLRELEATKRAERRQATAGLDPDAVAYLSRALAADPLEARRYARTVDRLFRSNGPVASPASRRSASVTDQGSPSSQSPPSVEQLSFALDPVTAAG